MKKRTLIPLLWVILCVAVSHTSVSAPEPELDLQTLIAGIKHFDAAIPSGKGNFALYGHLGREKKQIYTCAFDGTTFEEAQVRVDFPTGRVSTEIWDGERHWEIYRSKKLLFRVDISPEDYKHLNEAKPKLPLPVKAQLKTHKINISDDFRIESDERNSYSIIIDNVTEHIHYIYYTEEHFGFYTTYPEYGVRPECIINAQLDPRYWMTYGKITPNAYLMLPLWKLLETHESDILQTEILNGEETYRIRVKYPHTESLVLWISAEKGFRLVKLQKVLKLRHSIEGSLMKKGMHYLTERVLHYREYQPGLWFPEKVEQTLDALLATEPQKKGEHIGKMTLQTLKFEINTDVSKRFQLDIPEDISVFDYGLGKERPFRELGNLPQ